MGSVEIFANISNLSVTLLTLGLLFYACFYSSRDDNVGNGIWLLFLGLVMEFIATWLSYKTMEMYRAGHSIEVWVFLELLLLLISMVFLALSASMMLIKNSPDLPIIIGLGILGFIALVYFIFISPDGDMVANIRQIFPIAGFAYMSASFWAQTKRRFKSGFIFAAIVTSAVTLLLILKFLGVGYYFIDGWYIAPLTYILLSISILTIKDDLTAQNLLEAQQEIIKYNNRIEEIIKSSPFPIIISRLSDDKIILANNNAVKLFGIVPNEIERYKLKDFFADSENRQLLNERLEQERDVQDFEILVKTPTGDTPFWLLASANIIDYNYDVALYSAFQDITSRKNREVLLKNQAIRDPLTSLYNRRYFEEEVFKRIMDAKAKNLPYSVLMVDADHFKRVNDTYGHKVGDKVLIELAATCERALRDKDIVARYGGEEFVIFLAEVNSAKAKVVADRLRETISQIVVYSDEGQEVRFTVSIGISSGDISDNIDTLIKTSDEALYRAKEGGRNRVEVFTPHDLKTFIETDQQERNDEGNHHPIFDKENAVEISLLDGVEANHIQTEKPQIEEPRQPEPIKDEQ